MEITYRIPGCEGVQRVNVPDEAILACDTTRQFEAVIDCAINLHFATLGPSWQLQTYLPQIEALRRKTNQ